jgi:molecular chaperone GrpE
MTNENRPTEEAPPATPDPVVESATGQTTPPESEATSAETATDPLTQALLEASQWKDLAYRNAAELDNFRKRAAREAQETRAYANADLLRSILPVLDNFEMGLEAARNESVNSMIYTGMCMVQRQLADFLRDMGVQEVEALGREFDPNLHDAVAQEPSTEAPEGTVLRVTRRGYKLKDRLLRAANVIVSSGPATPAA